MTKISLVIKNHLNDALYEFESVPYMAARRIRFVKLLVDTYPDTSVEIDDDLVEVMWYELS